MVSISVATMTGLKSLSIPGYDIILIAGQSNTLFGLTNPSDTIPDVTGLDSTDDDIKQLGRFSPNVDTVMAGSEPLEYNTANRLGRVGFALAFAKWYKENHLSGGRQVLLVPCGVDGTSFSGNYWNEGDTGYNDLVAKTNTAKAIGDGVNVVKAMLWHQGESDANVLTGTQYKTAWKNMVTALETDISETDLVCVVGGLIPYHVNLPSAGYDTINTALSELPAERAYTGFADPQSPTVLANESGVGETSNHFSCRVHRGYPTQDFTDVSTIGLAGRYATAYESAIANIS